MGGLWGRLSLETEWRIPSQTKLGWLFFEWASWRNFGMKWTWQDVNVDLREIAEAVFSFSFFPCWKFGEIWPAKTNSKISWISLEEKNSKIFPISLLKNSKISPEKEKHWGKVENQPNLVATNFRAEFLLRILWCSQSGDNPENILAKFGYILDIKVEKKTRILWYSWLLLELMIKIWQIQSFISSKSGKFGSFFSMKNP